MPRYDVFLSHASADKPAVEHLGRKLQAAGLEPFLDSWHLVAGEPWQEALDKAVSQSSTCAVFFGPVSKGGAWRKEETQLALVRAAQDVSFRVMPVLLPGSNAEDVPGFLSLRTWVDFRDGLDDANALARLMASIRVEAPVPEVGVKPSLPYKCMAPTREPFVHRSEYTKVRDALLARETGHGTTVGITTAIHGAGGFGKTALAIELCYDPVVREHYPDGALWVQMRDDLNDDGRLREIRDVLRRWTKQEPPAFETVLKVGQHLIEMLDGKRVLLVVDDVWRPEDVTPFQGLGPSAALLVTTRDSQTLPTGSVPIHVDALKVPEAVQLLGAGLSHETGISLQRLATRLGEWPLLLKIVNGQLLELIREDGFTVEQAIQETQELLNAEGLTAFDRDDLEARHLAVTRTLAPSLRRLSPDEVNLYGHLAVLPEDRDIPLTVLGRLWGLEVSAVRKLCIRLYSLSLLLRFDRLLGTIRLHDVIRDYLIRTNKEDLAVIHRRLLNACRPASGEWADLPKTAAYLWRNLSHHLLGAGERDLFRKLLLDFSFLQSKLAATDVNALLADYSLFVDHDQELRLVRDALRLSAHVLSRNPSQLREQLWGRLLDRQEEGIRSLVQGSESSGIWIRPRRASLTRPGGALIRTIDHPGTPSALARLPNGRVVSGSDDGTLRVWDVENGQTLQTLEGPPGWVNAVAVLDSRRVVSGSSDRTLRVWDVESGQTLQTLEGHSDVFLAVVVLDSRRVVSGSSDRTLRAWDVESGQALQTLEGHSNWINAVAVLDSRRVVSGSSDQTLRVWDVESGQTLQTLEGHSGWVNAVAVLDSRRVVSGSSDRTLRVWDVESGQTLQTLEGHSQGVLAVAVLDSRRVVSGSDDRTLRVWDVESGEVECLFTLDAPVSAVAVIPDRRVIVAGDSSGRVHFFDFVEP